MADGPFNPSCGDSSRGHSPALDLRFHIRRASGARPNRRLLRDVCRAVLQGEQVAEDARLTISLVDDAEIARLNAQHRGIDRPTDVLSFPLDVPPTALDRSPVDQSPVDPGGPGFVVPPDAPRELGDVVISYPRVVAQAGEYGHSIERELGYLVAHGLLHILGHDHEVVAEQARMRAREEAALAAVGLTR